MPKAALNIVGLLRRPATVSIPQKTEKQFFWFYEKAESLRRGDLLRLRGSPKPTDVTVDGPGGDTPC